MNEVTIRSALATHSTGMSWCDLHKIATIFDMPSLVQALPPRYEMRLEDVTKNHSNLVRRNVWYCTDLVRSEILIAYVDSYSTLLLYCIEE